ncbi:DEAD/DEAH box helicase [Leuconostoc pseudomesenteroides]|uniref:DEAD/DEAH box helicase n=1 Tax=Leuconostoc pseudomesenteroides TaxID=33968 RepID=A0A5B8T3W3_LEUPS|nr:DEAD/DEAH box helicase [Leuconostoc pseudomesenteroides]MCC8439519.1 DEAD/DEAH box helicase [Leuconostoc pseudomesenteroides]MDG9733600.1 DEAD/DEAH box helicase [Leuconostoc pseudomesenteroides]NKZ35964.1 DEAD/DEAH box helicase [Leuconostoc pseudomesenteroides]QEA42545.1 DEAD/DEAH box helicase [Leuconostoc pseudomesenteroides]QQB26567.1 DEAD/DEAH box helicase [Leuconostoc pseudomesenteroides]
MNGHTIIQELNNKALEDGYLYKLLKKIQFNYGVFLFNSNPLQLTQKEFLDILRFSDILSRSDTPLNRNIALKIVSTLFDEYQGNEIYQFFAQNTMIKIGNFPSLKLLEKEGIGFDNKEVELDKILKKTFQQTSHEGRFFTDSQYETFLELVNSNHYSFSAGTSFGKSFLFSEFVNWIIKEKNSSENIVFLVPTRALITQVKEDIEFNIKDNNYKIVTNSDIPALFKDKRFIFVLTPERLLSYFANKNNPTISTMIIDEAQNIVSSDERSATFYHAITLAEQKSIKLYFASPNVPNPEVFLELVGNSTDESKSILDVSVVQNKFFVDFTSNKYRIYYDFVQDIEYDERELNIHSFDDFLMKMNKEDQSIIYCNSVRYTVEIAEKFSRKITISNDKELLELSKYIKENIHSEYFLANLIERGIAFHFGALPQELRKQIEELFKRGKIKYLFTTSTLLQGVNLPAKNLFILSDKIGLANLNELDFRNLAGRAGRLARELYGNLFVIRLDLGSKTERLLNFRNLPEIKSQILSGQKNFYQNIGNVLENKEMTNKQMSAKNKREIADYATVLTYQLKKNVPSQLIENFNQKNNDSKKLRKKMLDFNIPEDALMLSTTIRPVYQEKVYNLDDPFIFDTDYSAKSCRKILDILSTNYNWHAEEDGRYLGNENRLGYYSVLMSEWIQSKPLNFMIKSTIVYHESNGIRISINGDPTNSVVFQ